jgi:hypothetical protein
MACDKQAEKLYAWEDQWRQWNRATLTMTKVRSWVSWACKLYRVSTPAVKAHKGRAWSRYDPNTASISFERTQRNLAVALHEAAHHILWTVVGEKYEDHGKEFLGIFLFLLSRAGEAPPIALTASARKAGLKWISLDEAAPVRFKRRAADRQ